MASSYGNGSQDDDVLTLLPDGHQFVMSMPYTGSETNGVLVGPSGRVSTTPVPF